MWSEEQEGLQLKGRVGEKGCEVNAGQRASQLIGEEERKGLRGRVGH